MISLTLYYKFLTCARCNAIHFARQGYLSKFQKGYLKIFSQPFSLKARTLYMQHEDNNSTENDGDSPSRTGTISETTDTDKRFLEEKNNKERRDMSDNSENLGIPDNFSEVERQIFVAHKNAIEANYDTYKDPLTGYDVFTQKAIMNRGNCCGNACRHCPYGHIKVPEELKTKKFNSQFYI